MTVKDSLCKSVGLIIKICMKMAQRPDFIAMAWEHLRCSQVIVPFQTCQSVPIFLMQLYLSVWFGLFSFQIMNDWLYVNGVRRGQFRLHPLRPNGSGTSWGCITFFRMHDFAMVRQALLSRKKVRVPGHSELMAYGRVDVTGSRDFGLCKLR
ncbi:tlde1 domain-containing protein [Pantoea sp. B65]|uniref:tlde1 domain-containing protein n=1 Tax=Pantoea sp. B65 TaxID=2813359 RepID=UPI0039B6A58B